MSALTAACTLVTINFRLCCSQLTYAWVRVASPSTKFSVACPAPVCDLLVDPEGDLLHGGLRVRNGRR